MAITSVEDHTSNMANHEKTSPSSHLEVTQPLEYEDEEEPQLHARTYIALAAMFLLNFVQVFALTGPPAVLSYIRADLGNTQADTWIPNALSLVQAVLSPIIATASDTFQARKLLMVGCSTISFIGCAIAPGSKDVYRLIVAQILIGFGFASVALVYAVPSEILPRRWRPMAQAGVNVAAALGACVGPLIIGAFTKADRRNGWRNFYWVQMAIWGTTALCILFGYRPPRRRLDNSTFWQKIAQIDLIGCGLLTTGLTLFLTALNLGGGLYTWTNARVLATLVTGIAILGLFAGYEWKGTKTGILHHDLFAVRTFPLCVGLIMLENFMGFSYIVFYSTLTVNLFENDPWLLVAREQPFWIAAGLSTIPWGYISTKYRTIREPMFIGFLIFTAGFVGFATIQPGDSTNAVIFAGLTGLGFGAPLILVITGVQLSTPHELIATGTGVTTSARAVAATISTAIYAATLTSGLDKNLPKVVEAAVAAGLPPDQARDFLSALMGGLSTGASAAVVEAASMALKQAWADSLRLIYIIAAPFGVVACVVCLFIGDLTGTMTYRVDAPLEKLHVKEQA
ncbi:hypothetical protein H2200_012779 [Cladophialophora chaetospira]|uniref:Major facilitator superfamily (MFS) profile domain-containing protein n=1 Tax=Cladophialophora chaetospira TaxID=386627 RepID=A0AA39CBW7_9EURO|nr:hypothetical protein H2200_012779 [Cladophialophora chaetospira]